MKGTPDRSSEPTFQLTVEYLIYLAMRLVEEAFCFSPDETRALAVGRFFGRIGFLLAGDRRKVAIENLTIAFGNQRSQAEIRLMARKNFEHLAMLGVEFFRLRRWSEDKMAEKLMLEGSKNWNMAWLPGARATMFILAHVGSFEVLAALSRFVGVKGKLIVTGVPNRFVNRRMIFERGGQNSGLDILPHRGVVRHAVESLRNGEMLYVLADQRGDDTRPIWVDYFGRRVLANGVFAKLAMEGRASVYPALAVRTEDYRYKCIFGEEIPIQVSKDPEHDLIVNSQRFHNVFEEWLREYPEQGFWMHRKFGRKPKRQRKMNRISAWWRHRAKHAE